MRVVTLTGLTNTVEAEDVVGVMVVVQRGSVLGMLGGRRICIKATNPVIYT